MRLFSLTQSVNGSIYDQILNVTNRQVILMGLKSFNLYFIDSAFAFTELYTKILKKLQSNQLKFTSLLAQVVQ